MKPFAIALAGAAALAILPQPARACTMMVRNPPPTQARIAQWTRQRYAEADAVVEVEAVTGSNLGQAGRMRVVRAYKGDFAAGALIDMRPLPDSACGANDFAGGSRGIIMIPHMSGPAGFPSAPLIFQGYLSDGDIAALRRAGLLPPPGSE